MQATYKDIYTNKTFTVANNTVTDSFGNVATVSAQEWLELQGSDVVLVSSVNTDHLAYSYTNEQGNSVNVTYKERTAAQKALVKELGLKWSTYAAMCSQVRVVVICRLAGK